MRERNFYALINKTIFIHTSYDVKCILGSINTLK